MVLQVDVKTIALRKTCSTLRNVAGIKAPFRVQGSASTMRLFVGVVGGRAENLGGLVFTLPTTDPQ